MHGCEELGPGREPGRPRRWLRARGRVLPFCFCCSEAAAVSSWDQEGQTHTVQTPLKQSNKKTHSKQGKAPSESPLPSTHARRASEPRRSAAPARIAERPHHPTGLRRGPRHHPRPAAGDPAPLPAGPPALTTPGRAGRGAARGSLWHGLRRRAPRLPFRCPPEQSRGARGSGHPLPWAGGGLGLRGRNLASHCPSSGSLALAAHPCIECARPLLPEQRGARLCFAGGGGRGAGGEEPCLLGGFLFNSLACPSPVSCAPGSPAGAASPCPWLPRAGPRRSTEPGAPGHALPLPLSPPAPAAGWPWPRPTAPMALGRGGRRAAVAPRGAHPLPAARQGPAQSWPEPMRARGPQPPGWTSAGAAPGAHSCSLAARDGESCPCRGAQRGAPQGLACSLQPLAPSPASGAVEPGGRPLHPWVGKHWEHWRGRRGWPAAGQGGTPRGAIISSHLTLYSAYAPDAPAMSPPFLFPLYIAPSRPPPLYRAPPTPSAALAPRGASRAPERRPAPAHSVCFEGVTILINSIIIIIIITTRIIIIIIMEIINKEFFLQPGWLGF